MCINEKNAHNAYKMVYELFQETCNVTIEYNDVGAIYALFAKLQSTIVKEDYNETGTVTIQFLVPINKKDQLEKEVIGIFKSKY